MRTLVAPPGPRLLKRVTRATDWSSSGAQATVQDVPGMSIAVVCSGLYPVVVEAYCGGANQSAAAGNVSFYIQEGATYLAFSGSYVTVTGAGGLQAMSLAKTDLLSPWAGTRTFKMSANGNGASGNFSLKTVNIGPMYLMAYEVEVMP